MGSVAKEKRFALAFRAKEVGLARQRTFGREEVR